MPLWLYFVVVVLFLFKLIKFTHSLTHTQKNKTFSSLGISSNGSSEKMKLPKCGHSVRFSFLLLLQRACIGLYGWWCLCVCVFFGFWNVLDFFFASVFFFFSFTKWCYSKRVFKEHTMQHWLDTPTHHTVDASSNAVCFFFSLVKFDDSVWARH